MGDQCYVNLTFRNREAAAAFGKASEERDEFWNEVNGDDEFQFAVGVEECNYAWSSQMDTAAAAGVEFLGSHESGGDYPKEDFVTKNGEVIYAETGDGGYVVPVEVSSDGKVSISAGAKLQLEDFIAAENALRAKWSAT